MTEKEAIALLAILASETRLRMFRCLVRAGPDGLSAGKVADAVGASPSRASFHLSQMTDTGLLTAERDAKRIIYKVDFNVMGGLLNFLMEDCCGGAEVVRSCCGLPAKGAG